MCAPVRHARCAGLLGRKQPNPMAISCFPGAPLQTGRETNCDEIITDCQRRVDSGRET